MVEFIVKYLPWLLSASSIYTMILVGNLNKKSWLLGLWNQVLWLTWIVLSESWGFLPMNLAIWVVYTRNHFRWKRIPEVSANTIVARAATDIPAGSFVTRTNTEDNNG